METFWGLPVEGWVAIATIALVVVTALLWLATNSLVQETKASGAHQLRAYVGTALFQYFPEYESGGIAFSFIVKNHGRTPAQQLKVRGTVLKTGNAHQEKTPTQMFDLPAVGTLQPEQAVDVVLNLPNLRLQQQDQSAFNNGMLELMAVGQITYSDGVRRQHLWRRFEVVI